MVAERSAGCKSALQIESALPISMGVEKNKGTTTMSEIATPIPAKAAPLFVLDLEKNGGRLAPRDHAELIQWIQAEIKFWNWIPQGNSAGHENTQRHAYRKLAEAQSAAQQAQQYLQTDVQHSQKQLESSKQSIQQVFQQFNLPHSSTPLGKRVDAYRKEVGEQAAKYFLAVALSSSNQPLQFQPIELAAWRGLFQGLQEHFSPFQQKSRSKNVAQELAAQESFEQLRGKAEQLLGEKTEVYDALHRDYQGLAETIRSAAREHAAEFDQAQNSREAEFEQLKAEHAQEMEALRKKFKEELSLRAPAEYWESKRLNHRLWSIRSGIASFAGICIAAGFIGYQIHQLLNKTGAGSIPEAWRVGMLALIGVFTVWALRLVVRMFLSHLHLLADASERVVMVKTYLSLMEGEQLQSKEDRQLILQALFRPASDGIVKDEGIPFSLAEALTRSGKS